MQGDESGLYWRYTTWSLRGMGQWTVLAMMLIENGLVSSLGALVVLIIALTALVTMTVAAWSASPSAHLFAVNLREEVHAF